MKRIKTTRDLRVNDVLRVYKKGFGYAKLSVIDVHEQFISAKASRDFIGNIIQGDVLETYFWADHRSSYEFRLEVLGLFSIDLSIVFFKHTDRVKWSSERRCLQASLDVPFSFFIFDIQENKKVFSSTKVRQKRARLVRLSDREALIRYKGPLKEGAFVKGHIAVGDGEVDILGKVSAGEKDVTNSYLVQFTGMADREREKILDHVLTIYRE